MYSQNNIKKTNKKRKNKIKQIYFYSLSNIKPD